MPNDNKLVKTSLGSVYISIYNLINLEDRQWILPNLVTQKAKRCECNRVNFENMHGRFILHTQFGKNLEKIR